MHTNVDGLSIEELRDSRASWWSGEFDDFLSSAFADVLPARILDAGCGVGTFEEHFASRCPSAWRPTSGACSAEGAAGIMAANRKLWWRGARGEWLVVAQVALIALVFLGPRTVVGQPAWPFPFARACPIAGGILMVAGGLLLLAGAVRLGPGLTPLPYPKDGATLVQTGPFALVRHPMYSGGLLAAFGWALLVQGWLTVGYVIVLFVFLDLKSRREERWLTERFPTYPGYQRRVRKLVPFVY
jgi:protein-S-isoprenylcysteine O-methyltransferase Ste14